MENMKREFLKNLNIEGLTDEIIEKIMSENGKDIEATKSKADKSQEIEKLKSELEAKDQIINDANSQIEKFKGMDIEGIQKQAEEWKNKYTEFENQTKAEKEAYEQKLKQQAYEFKLNETVSQLKFPNELTKKAFMNELKAKNLPLEGEKILGFDDYIKEVGEQNPGIFVVDEPTSNEPQLQFSAPTNGQANTNTGFNFGFTPVRNVKN